MSPSVRWACAGKRPRLDRSSLSEIDTPTSCPRKGRVAAREVVSPITAKRGRRAHARQGLADAVKGDKSPTIDGLFKLSPPAPPAERMCLVEVWIEAVVRAPHTVGEAAYRRIGGVLGETGLGVAEKYGSMWRRWSASRDGSNSSPSRIRRVACRNMRTIPWWPMGPSGQP